MRKQNRFFLLFILLFGVLMITNSCTKTSTTVVPPTVVFVVLPNHGTTETNFIFDASESVDGTGNTTDISVRWDFENDGEWDTEWQTNITQTYQYEADGYYTVGMQLKDRFGYIGWTSRSLTVGEGGSGGPNSPVASFTVDPLEGNLGTVFVFDASASSDPQSPASELQVRWDYEGDGSWDTSFDIEKTASHQYSTEGEYNPKLEVMDPDGNTNTTFRSISVSAVGGMEYVAVNGGTFEMGCTGEQGGFCEEDEYPVHTVTISSFSIAVYETTNLQFAGFLNAVGADSDGYHNGEKYIHIESDTCQVKYDGTKFYAPEEYENRPAIYITWFGAKSFSEWVGGRLPTEAEWEYAARGGDLSNGYRYSGGNAINSIAWFSDNSANKNHDVGTKSPNELGIYDMSGNVREWCNDWFDYHYYQNSPPENPQGGEEGIFRVLRGGSFFVNAADCRVADRYWGDPENTFYRYELGFRVAKD